LFIQNNWFAGHIDYFWVDYDDFWSKCLFLGSWDSIRNWLEPKTKPPYSSLTFQIYETLSILGGSWLMGVSPAKNIFGCNIGADLWTPVVEKLMALFCFRSLDVLMEEILFFNIFWPSSEKWSKHQLRIFTSVWKNHECCSSWNWH